MGLHNSNRQACLLQACCASPAGRRRGAPAGAQALLLRGCAVTARKRPGTPLFLEFLGRALYGAAMGTPYEARQLQELQRAPGMKRVVLLVLRRRRWRCVKTSSSHAATHKVSVFITQALCAPAL